MNDFDQTLYKFDVKRDLLGKGTYARVYKATLQKGFLRSIPKDYPNYVAVKVMPKDKSGYDDTEAVLNDYVDFSHPNIVKYFKFMVKDEGSIQAHHIYMEFCSFDLEKVLNDRKAKAKPLSDEELHHVSKSMAEGLHHLHQQGLIHRDLKPTNLLIKADSLDQDLVDMTLKVSDFNVSKLGDGKEGTLTFAMGTSGYRAPEVLLPHKNHSAFYGLPADVFSFGAIVFEAATLQKLVEDEKTILTDIPRKLSAIPTELVKVFLHRCLEDDPQKRMKIEEVLAHQFFTATSA